MQNSDSTATDSSVQSCQFYAADAYPLQALYYPSATPCQARLIIASATGVPQQFYRRFAEYARQQGFDVLTFDYRGIGLSAPATLKNFKMDYLDWGKLDLAAAIDYFYGKDIPLFIIGHSYGGQALGLCPNHDKISAYYTLGTGVGWAGYMPWPERMKVNVFWNMVFPLMAAKDGYIAWSKLNMGADLPLDVYKQWRQWCKSSEYFFNDPIRGQQLQQQFAQVKMPIFALTASDDEWAMAKSRNAFAKYYRQAKVQCLDIQPAQFKLKHIGHMGYFRKDAHLLWAQILGTLRDVIAKQPKPQCAMR
ncbi:alpha/beta hydrolase family protein [Acinetobacter larvae]|uniref:Alpha/beta hydrolase n=1 Tax=Acinetobacter larvae TaxID=1789224 RepID=A0A1B2M182_9GAMM|nr:alpha/beta fold hydrolase [Acinetobacter larvae]AOA58935.1 alpha/beta hydrolase [Acinetobacter larvae]